MGGLRKLTVILGKEGLVLVAGVSLGFVASSLFSCDAAVFWVIPSIVFLVSFLGRGVWALREWQAKVESRKVEAQVKEIQEIGRYNFPRFVRQELATVRQIVEDIQRRLPD